MRKMLLGAHHIPVRLILVCTVYTVHTELRKRFEPCEGHAQKVWENLSIRKSRFLNLAKSLLFIFQSAVGISHVSFLVGRLR